jgi:hypothetical protein
VPRNRTENRLRGNARYHLSPNLDSATTTAPQLLRSHVMSIHPVSMIAMLYMAVMWAVQYSVISRCECRRYDRLTSAAMTATTGHDVRRYLSMQFSMRHPCGSSVRSVSFLVASFVAMPQHEFTAWRSMRCMASPAHLRLACQNLRHITHV